MTYKKFYKGWWYWYNDSDGRYHPLKNTYRVLRFTGGVLPRKTGL